MKRRAFLKGTATAAAAVPAAAVVGTAAEAKVVEAAAKKEIPGGWEITEIQGKGTVRQRYVSFLTDVNRPGRGWWAYSFEKPNKGLDEPRFYMETSKKQFSDQEVLDFANRAIMNLMQSTADEKFTYEYDKVMALKRHGDYR